LRHDGIRLHSVERAFNASDASGIKRLTNCQVYTMMVRRTSDARLQTERTIHRLQLVVCTSLRFASSGSRPRLEPGERERGISALDPLKNCAGNVAKPRGGTPRVIQRATTACWRVPFAHTIQEFKAISYTIPRWEITPLRLSIFPCVTSVERRDTRGNARARISI